MKRRDFIALLAGVASSPVPRRLLAEPRSGIRRLGVLMVGSVGSPENEAKVAALVQGLDALGWHQASNLRIDWRWAGGDPARFERSGAELIALGSEVIVAAGSLSTKVLQRQTNAIPIIFVHVTDPVGQGFVASFPRPGGNITGCSIYEPPMAGKWFELLTQVVPRAGDVGALFNPATTPYADRYLRVLQDLAPARAGTVRAAPCRDDAEIETIIARLATRHGGLLVLPNTFAEAHRDAIVGLAARYRLPAVYPSRIFTAAGGLMSYGVELTDLFRRAADYVDRILKGGNPANLPVQAPTKFELAINLKTAKALGLTIPPLILARADEVIE